MAELLEAIASAVGTTLLSDLHQKASIREEIPLALQQIPPGAYSLMAWQDAAQYILCDASLKPETERDAREMLEKLSKHYK